MNAVGSFVETIAGPIDGFWLALHLEVIGSRDDVPDNRAGMTVGRIGFPRCISDFNNGGREVVPIQRRQSVGKRRSRLFRCALRGARVLLSNDSRDSSGAAADYCNAEDFEGKLSASAGE